MFSLGGHLPVESCNLTVLMFIERPVQRKFLFLSLIPLAVDTLANDDALQCSSHNTRILTVDRGNVNNNLTVHLMLR
jgi:hypothetical protein